MSLEMYNDMYEYVFSIIIKKSERWDNGDKKYMRGDNNDGVQRYHQRLEIMKSVVVDIWEENHRCSLW